MYDAGPLRQRLCMQFFGGDAMQYYCNPLNVPYHYQFLKDRRAADGAKFVNREAADPSVVLFQGKYYLFASMNGSVCPKTCPSTTMPRMSASSAAGCISPPPSGGRSAISTARRTPSTALMRRSPARSISGTPTCFWTTMAACTSTGAAPMSPRSGAWSWTGRR